jgi:hypothetical protein
LEPRTEYHEVDRQIKLYWSPAKTEQELLSQLQKKNIHPIDVADIDLQETVGMGLNGAYNQ